MTAGENQWDASRSLRSPVVLVLKFPFLSEEVRFSRSENLIF